MFFVLDSFLALCWFLRIFFIVQTVSQSLSWTKAELDSCVSVALTQADERYHQMWVWIQCDAVEPQPHWLCGLSSCRFSQSPWRQTSAHRSGSSTCRVSSTRRRGRFSTRGRTSLSSRQCSSSRSTGNAWGRRWTAKPSTTTHLSSDTWR